jgi:GTP pyrophosphokinase
VVKVENLTHLNRVLGAIRKVKGVISVERREQVDASNVEA